MRWLAALALLAGTAVAQDPPFPEGDTSQTFGKRTYTLRMPAGFKHGEASLIVSVGGSLTYFDELEKDESGRYVVCLVSPRFKTNWSGGETKEVLALIQHLKKKLGIAPERIHAVSIGQGLNTIFTMVAFGKKSPFVSVCICESEHVPGSIAARSKKKIGVLAYDNGAKTANVLKHLDGKVRTLELRRGDDQSTAAPYYRYWLKVMEGRFEPGYDLSFDWQPKIENADQLKAAIQSKGTGAFVYFYSKADAGNKTAKALQNLVFLDRGVRERGAKLIPVKLDVSKHAAWRDALGLDGTPAVAVFGKDASLIKALQHKIKAKTLAKLFKKATK